MPIATPYFCLVNRAFLRFATPWTASYAQNRPTLFWNCESPEIPYTVGVCRPLWVEAKAVYGTDFLTCLTLRKSWVFRFISYFPLPPNFARRGVFVPLGYFLDLALHLRFWTENRPYKWHFLHRSLLVGYSHLTHEFSSSKTLLWLGFLA